jgi:hypothetical protein
VKGTGEAKIKKYAYFISMVVDVIDGCDLRYHHGIQLTKKLWY